MPRPTAAPVKVVLTNLATAIIPSPPDRQEMLNEHQVAEYLNMSIATVRRWRLFRKGPKFLKIGSAVRYKREEVEKWLDACAGLR